MGVPLKDLVEVVRSKNAGPYELTFDLIFSKEDDYQMVKDKEVINTELLSELYQIPEEDIISIIYFDPARAIKFTFKRSIPAGSVGERDVYGAQQHAPLLKIKV